MRGEERLALAVSLVGVAVTCACAWPALRERWREVQGWRERRAAQRRVADAAWLARHQRQVDGFRHDLYDDLRGEWTL